MADGQVAIRGHRSIVDSLILPRPLTRLVLILVGAGLGGICAWWFDPMLNARIAATAGGFCMLCAAVMWRIPESSGENALGGTAASSGSLPAEIFRAAREKAWTLRRRALLWSGWVVACAAAASLPALIASAVCAWMLLLAGGAVGEAVYSFFAVHALKEELHAFRDYHVEVAKRHTERQALIDRMQNSASLSKADEPVLPTVPGKIETLLPVEPDKPMPP